MRGLLATTFGRGEVCFYIVSCWLVAAKDPFGYEKNTPGLRSEFGKRGIRPDNALHNPNPCRLSTPKQIATAIIGTKYAGKVDYSLNRIANHNRPFARSKTGKGNLFQLMISVYRAMIDFKKKAATCGDDLKGSSEPPYVVRTQP